MSVLLETTLGDFVIDLFVEQRPIASYNFINYCRHKFYNFSLFSKVINGFIAQSGQSIFIEKQCDKIPKEIMHLKDNIFEMELKPKIKHFCKGIISFVNNGINNMHGSQFIITLADNLTSLDGKHTVFGIVTEGMDTIDSLNAAIKDDDGIPFQDIRITHTIIIDDPFKDSHPLNHIVKSPPVDTQLLASKRIAAHEDLDEFDGLNKEQLITLLEDRELKAGAQILEMVGDIPDAEMKPPENVLFVCKLNPVTIEDDLEILFARFGKIISCEIIRDYKTNDSLQYGFIEFENVEDCEKAFFKMDNVLIDDRRIHVNFCQSIKSSRWKKSKMSARYKSISEDEQTESYHRNFDEGRSNKRRGIRSSREYSSRR